MFGGQVLIGRSVKGISRYIPGKPTCFSEGLVVEPALSADVHIVLIDVYRWSSRKVIYQVNLTFLGVNLI